VRVREFRNAFQILQVAKGLKRFTFEGEFKRSLKYNGMAVDKRQIKKLHLLENMIAGDPSVRSKIQVNNSDN
jgi:hypothetical protein